VSLAARVGEQEWGTSRFVADADDLIGRLGKALAEHYDAQPVVVALAQGLEREAPDLVERKAPQLTGDTWEGHLAPDIAVFGAGVLSTGYPLLRSETTTFIKGIAGILKELDQHLQTGWQSAMLADVCNHYWVVGDPAADSFKDLSDIARRLNEACVSIKPRKLNYAQEKVLVAGGAQKYPAVLSVLKDGVEGVLRPTTLVTDEAIARRLLRDMASSS